MILEGLDEAIGLPQIPEGFFLGTHLNIFPDTVGKLTYYELSPLALSTIPIFSVAYIVSEKFLTSRLSGEFNISTLDT